MDEQLERLQRLIEVGRKLSMVPELSSMLQLIIGVALRLTDSAAASILELDLDGKNLHFKASLPVQEALNSLVIPVDESIAGLASKQKQAVAVTHVAASPVHYKIADELSGFHTHSILACPILFRGELLGIIEVVNKLGGADYNGEDVTILETLSAHAALALQTARLQTLLETTRQEAERLDKMKTDFVAITSHELRTPLGLILGHSTFLREMGGTEYQAQLDTIIRNAMRLKEIIDSMTVVDNFQSGMALVRRRTVSIRALISAAFTAIQKEAETKQLTLTFENDESELMIEGDAGKIGIAIHNLIKNAVVFTNASGSVSVLAEEVPGYVKITIKDTGIGIPARDLPHIFEQFYQVESHLTRRHGGMGLGLSVAKMNIDLHGGRLWVDSVEGTGSTFTVMLPLDSAQPQGGNKAFID